MISEGGQSRAKVSPTAYLHIDAVCDRFERVWKSSQRLSIEQLLAEHSDLPREALLHQLLLVELHLRADAGEPAPADELDQRFPDDLRVLNRVRREYRQSTQGSAAPPTAEDVAVRARKFEVPAAIGRFQIKKLLGRGGFGAVFQAWDPQRQQDVALKVPHLAAAESPSQTEIIRREADAGQQLDHPNLVRTLGSEEIDGKLVITQQLIDGRNLEQWSAEADRSIDQIVGLLVPVAKALGYLHEQGFFHRDLKPTNILVSREGVPYVADFGLVLHEDQLRDPRKRGELAGTYAFMAPEQIQRARHLIDGQSDLWSFGVILYRLLTNRYPFGGPPPQSDAEMPDYLQDLMYEISEHDPRPPRQVNSTISRRLEQICLRCLEKRKKDRYFTGYDLAEDLRLLVDQDSRPASKKAPARSLQVVPNGLRSYEAEDAAFFQELLPGPRTEGGVPKSLDFWRSRLSGSPSELPIDLGVIYGPSGCGKSSLVKAGLLPLLDSSFVPVFVEATAHDTEVRLLKALRELLPQLPPQLSLSEACRWVGERGGGRGRKVLLVLDQFEQWLHAHPQLEQEQLVEALHLCNGTRLQALLLVRDDFWMPLSRLMDRLEVPLQEGKNTAAVDLFDLEHAQKVLLLLGRAYGQLQSEWGAVSAAERQFLSRAVEGMAENRRVICVRLALFAQMLKDRPWTLMELRAVGGAQGIGSAFLEEKFGARAAAQYRPFVGATRRILEALLPPPGSDIRGQMRSAEDLQEVGELDLRADFEALTRILDSELKLLTPVIPDRPAGRAAAEHGSEDELSYQLTHDFLVPAIRDWLDATLKQTRAGRARIRLRELAAHVIPDQPPRYLPTNAEWLSWQFLLPRTGRSDNESTIMRSAGQRFCKQVAAWGGFFVVFSALSWYVLNDKIWRPRQTVIQLIDNLFHQEITNAPASVTGLAQNPVLAKSFLRKWADRPHVDDDYRLRLALGMFPFDHTQARVIVPEIVDSTCSPQQLKAILSILQSQGHDPSPDLNKVLSDPAADPRCRFRAACGLMHLGTTLRTWNSEAEFLASVLCAEPATWVGEWIAILRSAGEQLQPAFVSLFIAPDDPATQTFLGADRAAVLANAIYEFSPAKTECANLAKFILDANDVRFNAVLSTVEEKQATDAMIEVLEHMSIDPTDPVAEANLATALMRLGRPSVLLELYSGEWDSVPTLLSVNFSNPKRLRIHDLRQLYETESVADVNVGARLRRSMLQALAFQAVAAMDEATRTWLIDLARHHFLNDPDACCYSTSGLILRRLGYSHLDELRAERRREKQHGADQPYGNVLICDRLQDFSLQAVPTPEGGLRVIAVSMVELTNEEMQGYLESVGRAKKNDLLAAHPYSSYPDEKFQVRTVMAYCNTLGGDHFYPDDLTFGNIVDKNYDPNALGYRLPTTHEWLAFCESNRVLVGLKYAGDWPPITSHYEWLYETSQVGTQPVGMLLPNRAGLFDTFGNLGEICHMSEVHEEDYDPSYGRIVKDMGVGYRAKRTALARVLDLKATYPFQVNNSDDYKGFRVVWTLH